MSLRVTLFKFAKEHNSTARPSVSGDVTHVTLKDTTSFLNPILELQTATAATNPTGWNYAYISDFKRYYFINDWVYNRGIWEAHLMVDVLASWKEEIGASTQYILRSSKEYNQRVIDNVYPTTENIQAYNQTAPGFNYTIGNGGMYVVGIISNEQSSIGAVKYYTFSQAGMDEFLNELMSNTNWLGSDFGDITEDTIKAISNPFEYVVSCNWFPVEPSWQEERPINIELGWYTLPYVRAGTLIRSQDVINRQISIPIHPAATSRGRWLQLAPYSQYTLITSYFGEVVLDPRNMVFDTTLDINVKVDYISGDAVMYLATNGYTFSMTPGRMGASIQIAQFTPDLTVKAASTVVNFGQALGKGLLDLFGFDTSGVGNPINIPNVQSVSSNGVNGSSIGTHESFILRALFYNLVEEDLAHQGRPLCANRRISNVPGFIMVGNPEISLNCTEQENNQIINYMKGGFFYA